MNNNLYNNYYDVVILPSPQVRDYSISLSKQLHKYGSTWALGKSKYIPHISLYHIPIKAKDYNSFITNLENVVKGLRVGKLETGYPEMYEIYNAVFINVSKPDWLKKLYLKIIKKSYKYLNPNFDLDKAWRTERMPSGMKKNVKKYATPMVGHYFKPHITLGFFKDKDQLHSAFDKIKPKKYSFLVDSIFVCTLGPNHTCQKIVKRIYF